MQATSYGTPAFMDVWKVKYNTLFGYSLETEPDYNEDTNGTLYFMYNNVFVPWFITLPTSKLQFVLLKNDITYDEFCMEYTTYITVRTFQDNGNQQKITLVIGSDSITYDYGEIPSFKTFSYLYNEYADCHTAFDLEGFLNHFENDLQTFWKEFEATNKEIDRLMNLSDAEIAIEYSHIVNIAQIPETESSTDAESVNYITQQQKELNKKGNLQIIREQLVNKRAYTIRQFIARFKHLFIKVISPTYITVYSDDEGE